MDNETLSKKTIFWKRHPEVRRYWYYEDEEGLILLRINNFPEEQCFTIINGLDIMDFDEQPSNWTLEDLGRWKP